MLCFFFWVNSEFYGDFRFWTWFTWHLFCCLPAFPQPFDRPIALLTWSKMAATISANHLFKQNVWICLVQPNKFFLFSLNSFFTKSWWFKSSESITGAQVPVATLCNHLARSDVRSAVQNHRPWDRWDRIPQEHKTTGSFTSVFGRRWGENTTEIAGEPKVCDGYSSYDELCISWWPKWMWCFLIDVGRE